MNNKNDSTIKKTACVISSYAYIIDHINYGAILQYFALEKALKQCGIQAYWLRYTIATSKTKRLIKRIIRFIHYGKNEIRAYKALRSFIFFLQNYCHVSEKEYKTETQLKQSTPIADIYITGSDQVWAGTLAPNYLCFAPSNKTKCSYAASFGKGAITDEQKEIIAPWLQNIDFISVREASGQRICSDLGITAEKVLDPTLLIDANNYPVQKLNDSTNIFCYFLNILSKEEIYWSTVKKWSQEQNLSIGVACTEETYNLFDYNESLFLSPNDWLDKYHNAKYILTNTFHGTVFSVIFNKPFLFFKQQGKTQEQNERIYSFLSQLNLLSRIYKPEEDFSQQLQEPIDWDCTNRIISEERKNSINFISKVISHCEKNKFDIRL